MQNDTSNPKPNRLIDEKSPYLLQHAYNPVDWHAWGDEAFAKAAKEDKPVFLSIGYSTCHWCHVMEHESFEDQEVAALLNEYFVCIKVDREERPDIDHVYMTVCQLMTGSGGWPLNLMLTPDKKAFFAGTYFPKESRFGRMGLMDLAPRIHEVWKTKREDITHAADQVSFALRQLPEDSPGSAPGYPTLDQAYQELSQRFDEAKGGFGTAPKFPTPHNFCFLLRHWLRTKESHALEMVEKTLRAMRYGGIYDHVGFGFHRYSTDADWLLPHFEKMLYDQALLAMAYIETGLATKDPTFTNVAEEIFAYVLRDMTSTEGGFYSAEDADSEGHEGKFYVWTVQEVADVLGEEEARFMSLVYNFQFGGNFQEEATGTRTGANIAFTIGSPADIAAHVNMDVEEFKKRYESDRRKLFEAREKRVHPHKDDKILTDWNGLMIAALSRGAQATGKTEYSEAAKRAAEFILTTLRTSDGRLLHRFREGDAALTAHVDDYAFFIWGLLDLYETVFDLKYLNAALKLTDIFLKDFWDDNVGGFYFTPKDASDLPIRRKEIYDGATPSGNSVAALNLLRLGRLAGRPDLERKADAITRAFAGSVAQLASGHTQLLCALDFALGHSKEVVIVGDAGSTETKSFIDTLHATFAPNKVVLLKNTADAQSEKALPDYAADYKAEGAGPTAYVCVNFNCELPTNSADEMLERVQRE